MKITHLSPIFGAEVEGVDLSTLDGGGDFEEVACSTAATPSESHAENDASLPGAGARGDVTS